MAFFFFLFGHLSSIVVSAQVECQIGDIESLYVFVPPFINRDDPSSIRVLGLSDKFKNQTIWLSFNNTESESQLFPEQFMIPLSIDSGGNSSVDTQSLSELNSSIPEGTFRVQLRGGPILRQQNNGPFYEDYPVCFETSYTVLVEGGQNCVNLGDACQSGVAVNACPSATAGYCDTSQSPARWVLPQLTLNILGGADCQYLVTAGSNTCGQANSSKPFACGEEIMTRANSGDLTQPVEEYTMCCLDSNQCILAQGGSTDEFTEDAGAGDYSVCASNLANNSAALSSCQACMGQDGIWTAVGCISQDPKEMITKLVNIGIGILGGIFLLRVLAAGFTLTISQGDVKKTTEAKEMITESVIGALFILFSVTMLQFIGSGVLKIPGFG